MVRKHNKWHRNFRTIVLVFVCVCVCGARPSVSCLKQGAAISYINWKLFNAFCIWYRKMGKNTDARLFPKKNRLQKNKPKRREAQHWWMLNWCEHDKNVDRLNSDKRKTWTRKATTNARKIDEQREKKRTTKLNYKILFETLSQCCYLHLSLSRCCFSKRLRANFI